MTKQLLLCVLAAGAAACGGKAKPADTGPGGGGDGGPDRAALQAKLAAMPQNDACSGDGGGTLADLYAQQKAALVGDDNSPVDESFDCRADDAGTGGWQCTWSVFSKPTGAASDDPCGGECCSGYQIMVNVDASGALLADTISCIAPG